jgi:hypothetical protein
VVTQGSVPVVGSIGMWTGRYMSVGERGWEQDNPYLYGYIFLVGRVLCHQRELMLGELVVRADLDVLALLVY